MFLYFFLIIAGLSYAEIYVLIEVGSQLGGLTAIGLSLLTAFIGAALVRSQGLQTAFAARKAMERGEAPAQQMIEGLMLMMAGVFLFIPGFITDFIGMLLLLPPLRSWAARHILTKQIVKMQGAFQQGAKPEGNVYDHQGRADSVDVEPFTIEGKAESSKPDQDK